MEFKFSPFVRFISKTTYFINETVVARDCRILYIISGSGSFECGGERIALVPNTLVYYPYEREYQISSEDGMLFYTVNFDFTQEHTGVVVMTPLPANSRQSKEGLQSIPDELSSVFGEVISFENALWAENDIHHIYTETLNQNSGYTQICDSHLKILLINIYRRKNKLSNSNSLCEKIKDLIDIDLRLNIKELAATLNYHPFYLGEVFKKNEGCTLHKYLIQERLKKANELICTTQIPLDEIAFMCGFSSHAHFSVSFKKAYHVTPGHLRRHI